ncbi:MAG: hypothetical protein LBJ79_03075 [Endomicrobium sp.]|jgi:hypothetical protein|nr:hypothetical protein [Endomicrobium sp.]
MKSYIFLMQTSVSKTFLRYSDITIFGKETPLPENQSISFDTEHLQKVKVGTRVLHSDSGALRSRI